MIDRSFYAYTCDNLTHSGFEERFLLFQGTNNRVLLEYISSDFISVEGSNELNILKKILDSESSERVCISNETYVNDEGVVTMEIDVASPAVASCHTEKNTLESSSFNVLVDLCGVFKRSTIHDVRDLLLSYYGPDKYHYVYHIDQADGGDRVLRINSNNDTQVCFCFITEYIYNFHCVMLVV